MTPTSNSAVSSRNVRSCTITGFGTALPKNTVRFGAETRYRVVEGEDQLTLAVEAANRALERGGYTINDIDCIVAACAVGNQPIPCTAALIHEKIAFGTNIPALDINTTCTSFISAVDMCSYLIDAGRYRNVLIVSAEAGSPGLNPDQQESFELFSDGAAAVILSATNNPAQGVVGALQMTWSEGAHTTEIRGGLTRIHASQRTEENAADFLFDMQGRQVLRLAAQKLPHMVEVFRKQSGVDLQTDIDLILPHQASRALPMMMKRLGVPSEKYINWVSDYGNMISASIPFVLCKLLESGELHLSSEGQDGERVLLYGTAAGLTANMLALQL